MKCPIRGFLRIIFLEIEKKSFLEDSLLLIKKKLTKPTNILPNRMTIVKSNNEWHLRVFLNRL